MFTLAGLLAALKLFGAAVVGWFAKHHITKAGVEAELKSLEVAAVTDAKEVIAVVRQKLGITA